MVTALVQRVLCRRNGGFPEITGRDSIPIGRTVGQQGEKSNVEHVQSPGHFEEWVRAIKGGKPASSNFPNYAGPLTEMILLGNLAVWVAAAEKGEKVQWDPVNLKVKNLKGLEPIVKPVYRKGYTLDV